MRAAEKIVSVLVESDIEAAMPRIRPEIRILPDKSGLEHDVVLISDRAPLYIGSIAPKANSWRPVRTAGQVGRSLKSLLHFRSPTKEECATLMVDVLKPWWRPRIKRQYESMEGEESDDPKTFIQSDEFHKGVLTKEVEGGRPGEELVYLDRTPIGTVWPDNDYWMCEATGSPMVDPKNPLYKPIYNPLSNPHKSRVDAILALVYKDRFSESLEAGAGDDDTDVDPKAFARSVIEYVYVVRDNQWYGHSRKGAITAVFRNRIKAHNYAKNLGGTVYRAYPDSKSVKAWKLTGQPIIESGEDDLNDLDDLDPKQFVASNADHVGEKFSVTFVVDALFTGVSSSENWKYVVAATRRIEKNVINSLKGAGIRCGRVNEWRSIHGGATGTAFIRSGTRGFGVVKQFMANDQEPFSSTNGTLNRVAPNLDALAYEGVDPDLARQIDVFVYFFCNDKITDMLSESITKAEVEKEAEKAEEPASEEHAEAGNYKKGHISLQGLAIAIENAKGSTREGVDKDGKPWKVTLPAHYGYIKGTVGKDKDHLDVYVGDNPGGMLVFVVNQRKIEGGFDEHKIFLGFKSKEEAIDAYDRAFTGDLGPKLRESVVSTTIDKLKEWIKSGDTKKPFESKSVAEAVVGSMLDDDDDEDPKAFAEIGVPKEDPAFVAMCPFTIGGEETPQYYNAFIGDFQGRWDMATHLKLSFYVHDGTFDENDLPFGTEEIIIVNQDGSPGERVKVSEIANRFPQIINQVNTYIRPENYD